LQLKRFTSAAGWHADGASPGNSGTKTTCDGTFSFLKSGRIGRHGKCTSTAGCLILTENPAMSLCPVCGEPDGQFVGMTIIEVTTASCQQVDAYRCTRCEYEWQNEHRPPESFHPFSAADFELTEADVV